MLIVAWVSCSELTAKIPSEACDEQQIALIGYIERINTRATLAMRLDRFDLNLLVVLDVLLEECSVTRASERLHIGQSATSSALARLREYFGDELLVMTGRQLTLTPLAKTLIEPVRDTLSRARATLTRRPGFDPAVAERRFTIFASDYATLVLLADVVARAAQLAPGVEIDIRSLPASVLQVFERGGVDLLFMPEPYLKNTGHPYEPLFEDTQVCVVWNQNQLVGDHISFDEYMKLGHVAARLEERNISFEDWFLPAAGRLRRIEATVDHLSSVPLLLIGTQRIATMHRRLAEFYATHMPLRLLSVPFPTAPLVEVMAWPHYLDDDPSHAWLRSQISASAARLKRVN